MGSSNILRTVKLNLPGDLKAATDQFNPQQFIRFLFLVSPKPAGFQAFLTNRSHFGSKIVSQIAVETYQQFGNWSVPRCSRKSLPVRRRTFGFRSFQTRTCQSFRWLQVQSRPNLDDLPIQKKKDVTHPILGSWSWFKYFFQSGQTCRVQKTLGKIDKQKYSWVMSIGKNNGLWHEIFIQLYHLPAFSSFPLLFCFTGASYMGHRVQYVTGSFPSAETVHSFATGFQV